jgi:hypothetical protein
MTRDEHLAWAKKRALEYLDAGDPSQAFTSMLSDLGKHPDTENHVGVRICTMPKLLTQRESIITAQETRTKNVANINRNNERER